MLSLLFIYFSSVNWKNNLYPKITAKYKYLHLCIVSRVVTFQEEILQFVGEEAFSLGLLMGTEGEEDQLFCFHHLLLQEFVAGKFVATLNEVIFHLKF